MKHFRLAYLAVAAAAVMTSLSSCSSDPNPFDLFVSNEQDKTAFIKLDLTVTDTRAGQLSTEEEKNIKLVNVYVFDEKHELETTKSDVSVAEGERSVILKLSPGLKTIYVITAKSGVNPEKGTSIADFEKMTFVSTLDKLKTTSNGFMMVGKSGEQQIMISTSQEDMPESNKFSIEVKRLAAKAQVKNAGISGAAFGIGIKDISYRVCQTSDRMMMVHNGSDLIGNYVDSNENGTYDGYTIGNVEANVFLPAVTDDFKAEGCAYIPENIVSRPLSGNTTFLSLRIATTPAKYYSFGQSDTAPQVMEEIPADGATYYVVGIVDRVHGVSDYAVDMESKHVITFKNEADAQRYMSSLNTGAVSPITVSQTDSQMKIPSTRAEDTQTASFEVCEFKSGYCYYRVNIAHEEKSGDSTVQKYKVVRNKFYEVSINSVKSLGFSSESLLRPSEADAVLDAVGSAWISASISVADWDEIKQSVDL